MEFRANRPKKTPDAKHAPEQAKKKPEVEPTGDDAKDSEGKETNKKKGGTHIHKVELLDVGARVLSSLGLGPRVGVADIKYAHFSKQFSTHNVGDMVGILLKSLVKSAIANVGGNAMSDKML